MDLYQTGREKRQIFAIALILALGVSMVAAPVVSAAVQAVKVKNIDTKAIPGGAGQNQLSNNAVAVRTLAGGGGLINNGDCDGDNTDGRLSTKTVAANPNTVITALILSGPDVTLGVSAPALTSVTGPGNVLELQTTTQNPTATLALGNGLQLTPSELVFSCTGGDGNWVILGQLGS
ncbi:MAG TPA: hypothetical protein VFK89_00165 [Actinomycetota bacterium]|nr:hypothetical protein [Actinomycetota bacterium]